MTTNALYHPRNVEVDLSDLPREIYNEIASLHGQISYGDEHVLTCLGNLEPLYVWRHESGRYFARHFPNGNPDAHYHGAISSMSEEHRREADYIVRAGFTFGYDAQLEVSTGNGTRLDVAIYSESCNIGMEVQRSALSLPKAKSRATKSFNAGWPTAWITDSEKEPAWADSVPTARLTSRNGWSEELPKPNTAFVAISTFKRERDSSRPTGWWYVREPVAVLLDELVHLMPLGDIVPIKIGKKGDVVLADRNASEVIDSCTYPGASLWQPSTRTDKPEKETVQFYSRECRHALLKNGPYNNCTLCFQPLFWEESVAEGICRRCFPTLNSQLVPKKRYA